MNNEYALSLTLKDNGIGRRRSWYRKINSVDKKYNNMFAFRGDYYPPGESYTFKEDDIILEGRPLGRHKKHGTIYLLYVVVKGFDDSALLVLIAKYTQNEIKKLKAEVEYRLKSYKENLNDINEPKNDEITDEFIRDEFQKRDLFNKLQVKYIEDIFQDKTRNYAMLFSDGLLIDALETRGYKISE